MRWKIIGGLQTVFGTRKMLVTKSLCYDEENGKQEGMEFFVQLHGPTSNLELYLFLFFFQAEDGIRDLTVTGVQTCALPISLAIGVFDVANNSCTPLTNAQVDIWHCDALGVYSDVSDQGFDTTGQQFLRGYQLTDETGTVQFLTIYPGWYSGRAVHIHFTIRTTATDGSDYQFTSQFFFNDTLTDQVHAQEPYASKGPRDTRNSSDNIFIGGGDQLLLNVQGDNANGYTAAMNIGLDLTDIEVGAADSMGQPGGGPPP